MARLEDCTNSTYRGEHGITGVVREQIVYPLHAALKRNFFIQIFYNALQFCLFMLVRHGWFTTLPDQEEDVELWFVDVRVRGEG